MYMSMYVCFCGERDREGEREREREREKERVIAYVLNSNIEVSDFEF